MTTDPFTEAAYAESRQQWPMRDQRSAFESGARWAQRYLAAQEPTDAECVALLRVMYPDIPFNSPSHYPDAMARARAALSAARAARRDELRQKIHANYGLPAAVDAATLTALLDQLDQAEARIKAVREVLDRWQVDGYDALLRRIRRALHPSHGLCGCGPSA